MILENYFSVSFTGDIWSQYIPDQSCKSVFVVFWKGIRYTVNANCIKLNETKFW